MFVHLGGRPEPRRTLHAKGKNPAKPIGCAVSPDACGVAGVTAPRCGHAPACLKALSRLAPAGCCRSDTPPATVYAAGPSGTGAAAVRAPCSVVRSARSPPRIGPMPDLLVSACQWLRATPHLGRYLLLAWLGYVTWLGTWYDPPNRQSLAQLRLPPA